MEDMETKPIYLTDIEQCICKWVCIRCTSIPSNFTALVGQSAVTNVIIDTGSSSSGLVQVVLMDLQNYCCQ